MAENCNVLLYTDAVLNHKAAADKTEKCLVVDVDPEGTLHNFYENCSS